jgi:hypothetical protein
MIPVNGRDVASIPVVRAILSTATDSVVKAVGSEDTSLVSTEYLLDS